VGAIEAFFFYSIFGVYALVIGALTAAAVTTVVWVIEEIDNRRKHGWQ